MWSSYRQGAKQEKDGGSCKCGIDADGARNGRGATNFVRRTKQKRSRYERFCARHREGGRKRAPLLEQRGSLQVAFMPKRRQPRSCFYLGMNRCRCQRPSTRMDEHTSELQSLRHL